MAAPGSPARWTDGHKDGVGTAIAETSRVWFSTARGILTEVFYPAPDLACLRLLELVVTSAGFVSEEALHTRHEPVLPAEAAPLCGLVNTCVQGRYRIEKEIVADPLSDVILMHVRFRALRGEAAAYRLFCVVEPHLGNRGDDNTALLGEHKGVAMLFATRDDGLALAVGCSSPWLAATAGFVGADGREDLRAHQALVRRAERAAHGNVSLVAEIDHVAAQGEVTLALAFARTPPEAAHLALGSLHRGYAAARSQFLAEWTAWAESLAGSRASEAPARLWTRSASILKILEAKHPSGGRVAALSTPWGASRGPGIEGTYHLVWTRDLVESVEGLLAAGAHGEARHALNYLRSTQEADGHWPQNMHLDGKASWNADELDEAALPVVLCHLVTRDRLLTDDELRGHWPMVRKAAAYLARTGPSTTRDRWEDTAGVTPFTLATEIVALLVAAELGALCHEPVAASYLRDLADEWNQAIEPLLYRVGGALAERTGVEGYYVRARVPGTPFVRDLDLARLPPAELSTDALALVRFGLRAADDPRITNTVQVIDAVLRTELPGGPAWRRYPGDQYGEHEDGAPFDGHGIGRPWPLLTGERAHYELARGDPGRAVALLHAMESFANASGYLPEQVWDRPDVPARGLVFGGPSGSATPLGWAHAEYIKLCRSLADGQLFDRPAHAYDRYVVHHTEARVTTWRSGEPPVCVPAGRTLRIACFAPARVSWTHDRWRSSRSVETADTGLSLYTADLDLEAGEVCVRLDHREPRQGDGRELVFPREAAPDAPAGVLHPSHPRTP